MYRTSDRPTGECPTCRRGLARVEHAGHRFERCPQCSGVWLDELTLNEMWRAMGEDAPPLQLEPRAPTSTPRRCPSCGDGMAPVALHGVPVDRCGMDGIWFDSPELQVALASAALPDKDWRRRFARSLATMR